MAGQPELVLEIKRAFRACKTTADVHSVADKYRSEVQAMHKVHETKVFAIQIINLKDYMLNDLRGK